METIKQFSEWAATGIEVATVVVIALSTLVGSARFLVNANQRVPDAFKQYKARLGKMLILSLELLVAADIIRTVVLEPTLMNAVVLGLLILIRTFLSWSLSVEIEGHWPWKAEPKEFDSEVFAK